MIKIEKYEAISTTALAIYVSDDHRSDIFEFYINYHEIGGCPNIPVVTWNKAFDKTFRCKFPKELLKNVMNFFTGKKFSMPAQLEGELKG